MALVRRTIHRVTVAVVICCPAGAEGMRTWFQKTVNYLAKVLPVLLLAVPMLLAAQAYQQNSGIIDMDGERFPPENPNEKAE